MKDHGLGNVFRAEGLGCITDNTACTVGMPLPPGELTVHRVRNAAGDAIQTEGKDGRETPFTRVESLHHSTIEVCSVVSDDLFDLLTVHRQPKKQR